MTLVVLGLVSLLVLALAVVLGTHLVRHPDPAGGGAADALGGFIDVFDPARGRADRELDSLEHQGEVAPTPREDDRPVRVDLGSGIARVRVPGA